MRSKFPLYAATATALALLFSGTWKLASHPGVATARAQDSVAPGEPAALRPLLHRQEPELSWFDGCPPEGSGGDRSTNRLKNRSDSSVYRPTDFASVLQLSWPRSVEGRPRGMWTREDAAVVARYEGTPVAVEGYLARVETAGPDVANCFGQDPVYRGWNLWLVDSPGERPVRALAAVATPRVRASHPAWHVAALRQLRRTGQKVRLSGWLLLHTESAAEVGKTRATLWAIHPLMRIEVLHDGQWIKLDDFSPLRRVARSGGTSTRKRRDGKRAPRQPRP
jgi:hypothetical protein